MNKRYAIELLDHRLFHLGVRMAKARDGCIADIEIGTPISIIEIAALTAIRCRKLCRTTTKDIAHI